MLELLEGYLESYDKVLFRGVSADDVVRILFSYLQKRNESDLHMTGLIVTGDVAHIEEVTQSYDRVWYALPSEYASGYRPSSKHFGMVVDIKDKSTIQGIMRYTVES